MSEKRYRSVNIDGLQVRAVNGATVVEGHAALFDTLSEPLWELGGAREKIAPGAFTTAIAEDDVRALINHDPNLVLGRNKAGTLTLKEDEKGLWFSAQLPSTSYARDLVESMRRGDVNQNSFGFTVDEQVWEKQDGEDVSVVRAARLFDVSVVTFPAYVETFSQVRSVAEALTRKDPSPEERARIKEFAERCERACGSAGSSYRDTAGGGCSRQHAAESDVDIATAREIRRREIEIFGLDA
jgi:HK97 family phage prohead protease